MPKRLLYLKLSSTALGASLPPLGAPVLLFREAY